MVAFTKGKFNIKEVPEEIMKEVDIEQIKLWASLDARAIVHKWCENQIRDGREINLDFVAQLYARWNRKIETARTILYALQEV